MIVDVAEEYAAVYPASCYAAATKTYTLPAAQTYAAGSFDPAAYCSLAQAKRGDRLSFKALCGMLKVTLTCPNVVLSPSGTDFYIVLPDKTFSGGFKLVVSTADGDKMNKGKSSSAQIKRNIILKMPALAYLPDQVQYSTDGETYTLWTLNTNNPTGFTDLWVKTLGDTKLTYAHLTALKTGMASTADGSVALDMGEATFESPSLGNAVFSNNKKLKSVAVPQNIIALAWTSGTWNGVFQGCSNLQSITLPAGLVSITEQTVASCTSLTTLLYPGQTVENRLPDTCTGISSSAFFGCTALKKIWIPRSAGIRTNVFYNCTSLFVVIIGDPQSLIQGLVSFPTSTSSQIFLNCGKLKHLGIYSTGGANRPETTSFSGVSGLTLSVPANQIDSYKGAWTGLGIAAFDATDLTTLYIQTAL